MVSLNKKWPQKRKCKQCGEEFEVDYLANAKKFCSIKCSNRYRYVRKNDINWPKKKNCIICGTEFLVSKYMNNKKYCSKHCTYIAYKNKNIIPHRILCLYCGTKIITTRSRRRYCSNECGKKYNSLNRPHRPSKAYLKRSYPYFKCQNCGYKFKLNFDPRKEKGKLILKYIKCPKCQARKIA